MKKEPLISIIIPFFNTQEREVNRCITSIRNQSFSNFEVIIINDGSSDERREYIEKMVESDDRIKLYNKINEGSAIARNTGVQKSCGKYIMFVDADDEVPSFCLEEAAQVISSYNPDLVMGGVLKVNEENIDEIHLVKEENPQMVQVRPGDELNSLMAHMMGAIEKNYILKNGSISDGPWARVIRRTIVEKCLFSTENMWNDDTIWNIKMLGSCKEVYIIDDYWYKYLIVSTSKTRRFRPNCPYEFKYRTKQEIDLFRQYWPNCMQGAYMRIFSDILMLSRMYLFHSDNEKSIRERYNEYKTCITQQAVRETLHKIDFTKENFLKRMPKQVFRITAYYGPRIVSYWMLKAFYTLRKDTL